MTAWRCVACGSERLDLVPGLDRRFARGRCPGCKSDGVFRELVAEPPPTPTPRAAAYARGMAGSELAAEHRWTVIERMQVDRAIRTVAGRLAEFTADDVWLELGPTFPVTKGLAGRLNAALHAGIIGPTGRTTISKREGEHGHAQRLAVWLGFPP